MRRVSRSFTSLAFAESLADTLRIAFVGVADVSECGVDAEEFREVRIVSEFRLKFVQANTKDARILMRVDGPVRVEVLKHEPAGLKRDLDFAAFQCMAVVIAEEGEQHSSS